MRVAAVVYSREKGHLRYVIRADNLANLAAPVAAIGPDEDAIIVNPPEVGLSLSKPLIRASDLDEAACYRLIFEKLGRTPELPVRCVTIDGKMNVVDVFLGDPSLDAVQPEGTAVHDPLAEIGDRLVSDGKFYRPDDAGELKEIDPVAAEGV